MTTKTDRRVHALVDLVLAGNLTAAFPIAESLRAVDPAVEQARVSHVQWLAAGALEAASAVFPHALRVQEEAVHALHSAMNEVEQLTGYAKAVTAAAERVEELEILIADLEKIAHPLHAPRAADPNDEPADDEDDTSPAGDCDA